jgi:hypothetical protein
MSAHPPWQGKAPAERTDDGRPIVMTRYGLFAQREDGAWVPYYSPEEEADRLFRPHRPSPLLAKSDWNPLDG